METIDKGQPVVDRKAYPSIRGFKQIIKPAPPVRRQTIGDLEQLGKEQIEAQVKLNMDTYRPTPAPIKQVEKVVP